LALRLAREPERLAALRGKLADNRDVRPLFDTERFTRAIEAAYATMWERAERGEPPQGFAVANPGGAERAPGPGRGAGATAPAPDPAPLLAQAVACHRAGQLAEAEQFYRRILEAQPTHFDSLHL